MAGGLSVSIEPLLETLTKLVKLHKSLNEIAKQKTETLKQGDMDELQKTIKEEQLHLKAIKLLDVTRQRNLKSFLEGIGNSDGNLTLSACIDLVNPEKKLKLIDVREQLVEQIDKLKERNKLNQSLIEQSLDFVNMSLDLLTPDPDSYNYGNSDDSTDYEPIKRSMFDSKA